LAWGIENISPLPKQPKEVMSKQLTSIEEWETLIAKAPREAVLGAMAEQIAIMEGLVELSQRVINLRIHSEVERLTEVLSYSRKVLALMTERLSQD
jgi:hypothetical protein